MKQPWIHSARLDGALTLFADPAWSRRLDQGVAILAESHISLHAYRRGKETA